MLSCSPGARLFTHGGLRGVAVSGACRAWRLRRWAGPAASRLQHRSLRPRQRRSPATTVASAGDIAGLVVFSALPFVAVQALADSEKGKELQARLQARIPHLKREAVERAALREQARGRSRWYGSARPLWLGPLGPAKPPTWLDGSLPGDYGFDPLALGRRPGQLDRLVELELLHARWAMLAALGALLPEALQLGGAATFLESRWWNVGYAKLSTEEDLNYLGVAGLHVAGGQGVAIIALCQALLMFGPEYARACGVSALEPLGVYLPGDRDYPGGWLFDPLGLAEWDADAFVDLQVKEVKHGRLAMVAWLGFAAQAVATRVGPVRNLLDVLP